MSGNGGYTWSRDEEIWNNEDGYISREDAADAAREEDEGPFWTGRCVPYDVPRYTADDIMKSIQNQAYDDVGDVMDNWPSMTSTQADMMAFDVNEAIRSALAEADALPEFYWIRDTRHHVT